MKKIGGLAKGAVKGAVKETMASAMQAAVKEIIDETGATDIAKKQVIDAGTRILGDKKIPNKEKIQKDLLKKMIKRELKL